MAAIRSGLVAGRAGRGKGPRNSPLPPGRMRGKEEGGVGRDVSGPEHAEIRKLGGPLHTAPGDSYAGKWAQVRAGKRRRIHLNARLQQSHPRPARQLRFAGGGGSTELSRRCVLSALNERNNMNRTVRVEHIKPRDAGADVYSLHVECAPRVTLAARAGRRVEHKMAHNVAYRSAHCVRCVHVCDAANGTQAGSPRPSLRRLASRP